MSAWALMNIYSPEHNAELANASVKLLFCIRLRVDVSPVVSQVMI